MYDASDVKILDEFKRLNDQSEGRLKIALEQSGWVFDENALIESDLAKNGSHNSSGIGFSRDLYKSARDLGLNL